MAKLKKPKSKPPKEPDVKRITVDERFGDWSIRLLIATLAGKARTSDKKIEFQNINNWNPEKCIYATRKNFIAYLGLGSDKSLMACAVKEVIGEVEQKPTANLLWLGLKEGQVFILGKFRVQGERFEPEYLTVSTPPNTSGKRLLGIVDCCDGDKTLKYVKQIIQVRANDGIDIDGVAFICATHPHFDNISGIKALLTDPATCPHEFWDSGFGHN